MSTKQHGNFNGQRMVSTTFDSIDSITERYEDMANEDHASIILEESFWSDLQNALTQTVSKKRQMLAAGGYTDAAKQLRTIEVLSIRTAVEEFRSDTLDEPDRIHSDAEWNQFRARIREHARTQSF